MLLGVFIIVDDEYDTPVYADPAPGDLDDELWEKVCEIVEDVLDRDTDVRGSVHLGETVVGWRALPKLGLTFVAVVSDDVRPQLVESYLQKLAKRYTEEVDDLRSPERGGVADIVVDVIPPWEEDES